jgi:excisionase family DNA binding protein
VAQPFMVEADVVAQALNISVSAVHQLAKKDELPVTAHRFGRSVRFKRTELEEFLGAPLSEVLGAETSAT